MIAGIPIWIWGAFLAFVAGMLALDLGVFHRKAHTVEMKEALIWSGVWIALALLFNLGLYFFWDRIQPGSAYTPKDASLAFLTGYLVEKALSIDNIFVFLMVFGYFNVPAQYQHRVLFWGIIGALVAIPIAVIFETLFFDAFEPWWQRRMSAEGDVEGREALSAD